MAERTITTKIILEGNEEFVRGMDGVIAAIERAITAAKELDMALSRITAFQNVDQTSSNSAPQ